jgi:hypothetical protein
LDCKRKPNTRAYSSNGQYTRMVHDQAKYVANEKERENWKMDHVALMMRSVVERTIMLLVKSLNLVFGILYFSFGNLGWISSPDQPLSVRSTRRAQATRDAQTSLHQQNCPDCQKALTTRLCLEKLPGQRGQNFGFLGEGARTTNFENVVSGFGCPMYNGEGSKALLRTTIRSLGLHRLRLYPSNLTQIKGKGKGYISEDWTNNKIRMSGKINLMAGCTVHVDLVVLRCETEQWIFPSRRHHIQFR